MNLKSNTALAIKAAVSASAILKKNFRKKHNVTQKADKSFVTNIDIECESSILPILKATGYSILSEEAGIIKGDKQHRWIIDPLDGTHNFIHGQPLFGTSIALEEDGKVILGVITIPLLDWLLVAKHREGVTLNGIAQSVSKRDDLKSSLIVFDGSIGSQTASKLKLLNRLALSGAKIRIQGAAVTELASVACGLSEGLVTFSTHPWDVAAGFLMINEAGGKITDFSGSPVDISCSRFAATNAKIHDEILSHAKEA